VVRDAIASGAIGTPTGAISFGSSSLLHGHIHTIDTLSFLLGDPGIVRVRGELLDVDAANVSLADGGHIAADPNSTYQLEFANGVIASAVPTGAGASYEVEVVGTEGSVRCWHQLASETVGSAASGARLQRKDTSLRVLFDHEPLVASSVRTAA